MIERSVSSIGSELIGSESIGLDLTCTIVQYMPLQVCCLQLLNIQQDRTQSERHPDDRFTR